MFSVKTGVSGARAPGGFAEVLGRLGSSLGGLIGGLRSPITCRLFLALLVSSALISWGHAQQAQEEAAQEMRSAGSLDELLELIRERKLHWSAENEGREQRFDNSSFSAGAKDVYACFPDKGRGDDEENEHDENYIKHRSEVDGELLTTL